MHIITGVHQVEAEVAAGRLRSAGIDAHVVRDDEALLGVAGSSSLGTFSVAIADSDAGQARSVLKLRARPARETDVGRAMADRMTPTDADLVADRVVARIARLVAAIAVTLLSLSILPVLLLYTFRFWSPEGPSWPLVLVLMAAVVAIVFALARFWSRMLRGAIR